VLNTVCRGQFKAGVEAIGSLDSYKKSAVFWAASASTLMGGFMQTNDPSYIPAAAGCMLGTYLVTISRKANADDTAKPAKPDEASAPSIEKPQP